MIDAGVGDAQLRHVVRIGFGWRFWFLTLGVSNLDPALLAWANAITLHGLLVRDAPPIAMHV